MKLMMKNGADGNVIVCTIFHLLQSLGVCRVHARSSRGSLR